MFTDMLLYSEKQAAADLNLMNNQGPHFQLKIFFTVLLKKKKLPTYWMAWGGINEQQMFISEWIMPLTKFVPMPLLHWSKINGPAYELNNASGEQKPIWIICVPILLL